MVQPTLASHENSATGAIITIVSCREGLIGTAHRSIGERARGRPSHESHQTARFAGGCFHPEDVARVPALRL